MPTSMAGFRNWRERPLCTETVILALCLSPSPCLGFRNPFVSLTPWVSLNRSRILPIAPFIASFSYSSFCPLPQLAKFNACLAVNVILTLQEAFRSTPIPNRNLSTNHGRDLPSNLLFNVAENCHLRTPDRIVLWIFIAFKLKERLKCLGQPGESISQLDTIKVLREVRGFLLCHLGMHGNRKFCNCVVQFNWEVAYLK